MSLTNLISKNTQTIAAAGLAAMLLGCPKKTPEQEEFDAKAFANSTYGLEITICKDPKQIISTTRYECEDENSNNIIIDDNRSTVGNVSTTFYGTDKEITWMLRKNETGWKHDEGRLDQETRYDCKTTQDIKDPNLYTIEGSIKDPKAQSNTISITAQISGNPETGYIVNTATINFPNGKTNTIKNGQFESPQVSIRAGLEAKNPFDYCSSLASTLYDTKNMWE